MEHDDQHKNDGDKNAPDKTHSTVEPVDEGKEITGI